MHIVRGLANLGWRERRDLRPMFERRVLQRGHLMVCTPCPAGNFSASPTGSCDACAAGTYQPLTGQTSCTDCAAGNFSSSTGSESCDVCAAGTYQDQVGQSSCTDCAPGEYQDEAGQTTCKDCAAGKYQPLTGQTSLSSCIDCPAGSISAAVKAPSCERAQWVNRIRRVSELYGLRCGKYQALTGQTSCTDCPVGNYSASPKSPSCAACAAGEYQGQVWTNELHGLPVRILLRGGGQAQVRPMRVGLPLRGGAVGVHPMHHRVPVS